MFLFISILYTILAAVSAVRLAVHVAPYNLSTYPPVQIIFVLLLCFWVQSGLVALSVSGWSTSSCLFVGTFLKPRSTRFSLTLYSPSLLSGLFPLLLLSSSV
jgi:hypothetical protein